MMQVVLTMVFRAATRLCQGRGGIVKAFMPADLPPDPPVSVDSLHRPFEAGED